MKTWSPDTCGCCIEEIYENNQIVGGGQVIRKCEAHADVPDDELYGVLYANPDGENKMKNHVHRILLGHDHPKGFGLHKKSKAKDGTDIIEFKDGVEYAWEFRGKGKNRKLHFQVKGADLTPEQKAEIQSSCHSRFGPGKITIV